MPKNKNLSERVYRSDCKLTKLYNHMSSYKRNEKYMLHMYRIYMFSFHMISAMCNYVKNHNYLMVIYLLSLNTVGVT